MEGLYSASSTSPRHRFSPKQTTNQRRQSVNTAASGHSDSTQPWTATRCHRLLRPLLAHIAALRKYRERRVLSNSQIFAAAAQPKRTVLGKRSYPADDSDYDDKKPCRKYSRKGSRRRSSKGEQSCTPQRDAQRLRRQPSNKAPQDVVLPTPFLRRVRSHQPSSPYRPLDEPSQEEPAPANTRCSHTVSGCKTKCSFEVELAGLRSTMEGERHGLYESVFKAFDAILRVTSPRKNQTAGPKSLMALCLRKVPAYISALEDWERKESENNGTKSAVQGAGASFETYLELESLGAVDGWRQLCLVVRAHAVKIIQDAAAEGLLEDPVTDLLIRVCLEYMSPTEFMGLIDTFVFRQYPKPHSPNDDLFTTSALQPLKILKICDPLGTSLLPSVLADLLAEELLQADWILTESFVSLWPSMIRQITEMKPCQDTVEFVVATLENLCDLASPKKPRGVPQTKLRGKSQTTLISAAAALGSVVLLSEEGSTEMASGSSPTNRAVTLRRRITYIVTTCTAKLKHRKTGGRKLGTYILALCSFLSLPASPPSSPTISSSSSITIQTAWKDVTTCHNNPTLLLQYDATTALMSAMAHHLGRGTGLPPHIYLSQFCDQLATLALSPTALSNMRVDGAFRLAEQTGDLRDLEWAEGLRVEQTATMAMAVTPVKKTMSTRSGRKRGKRKAKSFSGFEWDDGISEWVAATPGMEARPAAARVRRLTVSGIVESEDEDEQMKDETDEEMDHGMDETASETEPNEVDSASDDDDDDSNAASETDPDEGEAEEPTLSPNTEPSPAPVSQPVPEPEPPKPQPQQSDAPAPDKASPGRALPPPSRAMPPPPPPGGFLAARPRRLSRPVPQTVDDQPTIANNIDNNTSAQESFLLRKKPTRFRSRIPIAIPATRKEPAVVPSTNRATKLIAPSRISKPSTVIKAMPPPPRNSSSSSKKHPTTVTRSIVTAKGKENHPPPPSRQIRPPPKPPTAARRSVPTAATRPRPASAAAVTRHVPTTTTRPTTTTARTTAAAKIPRRATTAGIVKPARVTGNVSQKVKRASLVYFRGQRPGSDAGGGRGGGDSSSFGKGGESEDELGIL